MATGGVSDVDLERQNTEDLADLPLQIPVSYCACIIPNRIRVTLFEAHRVVYYWSRQVSSVYEHFQCPICMSTMDQPSVTTCGHRFCFKCIEECVSRRHQCPCCKAAINRDDIINDHSFDALMSKCVRLINKQWNPSNTNILKTVLI